MRRMILVALLIVLAATLAVGPAQALPPTACGGLFYGIEATCMMRVGGPNLVVLGAAYRNDNPPAQIVVELFKWPVSVGDNPLARCDTDGGVLRECQKLTGAGPLASGQMLSCRVRGIAEIGAFACVSF